MNEKTKLILKNIVRELMKIICTSFFYENDKEKHKELSGAYTRMMINKLITEINVLLKSEE